MKKLMLLFSFMTRLPVSKKGKTEFDSEELGKSMKFFPVIGLVIGLILYLFARGISSLTSPIFPFLLSVLILLLEVAITGALHLDGLADTFDGMFSYRSKQKILEIMKDSRLGTNGALALIFYFLLKWSIFAELFYALGKNYFAIFLITMPVIARLGSVIHCAFFPYARATGMGKSFVDYTGKKELVFSMLLTGSILGVVWYLSKAVFSVIVALGISCLLLMLFQYLFGKLVQHKIGGITGDTLGALVELSEVMYGFFLYICIYATEWLIIYC
ncbi:adenosylcobinamide-GDP ribazoletransferase [Fusobacterium necrophorum]|uniref:Adenosylcobinamide-GDP ribazoletransferase n=1 Tax=Fusobacterium necrophorum DJ-2 TaxID=1441737 RepID=A0AB73BZP3_9FUSO|nr:adenosylcobinamide-GDP ribazoletransferase [Fusobacterium necrophorum]KDE61526.1 cobalamin synthase [Fusobacterium necrophorum DJ-1]KDE66267.1 cobalamin synthase [Fusobacterium necrophorum BFTR-1]KDE68908.1 cobalamin synthase [Fusobacterium necrophorum DAB]KDE69034.1 cobalamin synthase [Fusobacterium necrophorum DJ-2]KDE74628.1 cobalamin synthase [Fusobacterium necrophorum BFTR-2]